LEKKSQPAPLAQHVTIQEAAGALAVSTDTIRRRIADGTLAAVRIGARRPGTLRDTRHIRIPAAALSSVVEPVTAIRA
jgi:excisionase family DNA binding protein